MQNVKNLQSIIEDKIKKSNDNIVLVFSAFGNTTNNLINNISDIFYIQSSDSTPMIIDIKAMIR